MTFDAAGTLIHLDRTVGDHYAEVAARSGCVLEAGRLTEAFFRVWRARGARRPGGVPAPDDERGMWREIVDEVLDLAGVAVDAMDRDLYFERLYDHFAEPGVWRLFPDVARVLDRLAGRVRLAVLSNFDGRLRRILGDLGIASRFERMIISSEVGAEKPAAAIFRRALEDLGLDAGEVLHVGDDPRMDWEGARALGMRVFELDRARGGLEGVVALLGG